MTEIDDCLHLHVLRTVCQNLERVARRSDLPVVQRPHDERRSYRRYQLDLDIRCRVIKNDLLVSGRVRDMSSASVCFMSAEIGPPGTIVELCINWPVRLPGKSAIQLKCWGCVIRGDEHGTVVSILHYQFCTQKDSDRLTH